MKRKLSVKKCSEKERKMRTDRLFLSATVSSNIVPTYAFMPPSSNI